MDAAIIRSSLFTSATGALPAPPDLTGTSPAHVADQLAWLRRVWAEEAFAEAVTVASADLAATITHLLAGRALHPRRLRRAAESTLRYLLRATGRATPFGLFAGVAPLRLGERAEWAWADRHQGVARPDAAWLTALIHGLEARPDVWPHLRVMTNTLAHVRGDRLVIPCRLRPADTVPADVEIRLTPPVCTVLRAAQAPITLAELTRLLSAELVDLPDSSDGGSTGDIDGAVKGMLAALVEHGVLLSSLHPPMDVTDPLTHLITELAALGPAAPLDVLDTLHRVRGELAGHATTTAPEERRALRTSATRRMSDLHDHPPPAPAIDLRLDCRAALPPLVTDEATAAAAALIRLTPHPYGNPAWLAWHTAFLERWGIGAIVPLADALNPDTGLGFPAGYRGSSTLTPAQPLTSRDRLLLRLAQQSALDDEAVVLDENLLDQLAADHRDGRAPVPVPHTELRFAVHAPTTAAIDEGDFTLVVISAARQAGTTAGRFLHLLASADRDRMTQALSMLPTLAPDAMLAQVSCPPISPRAANLARSPAIAPTLSLGEHRAHRQEHLPVSDLAISSDARHLFLISLASGTIVEPLAVHALDFRHATHPLARFLVEAAAARAAACTPFSWGAAKDLPFLPRVTYRRTILSPAAWNLAANDLPGRTAAWPTWAQEWKNLAGRRRVPARVCLGERDQRLRLNLDEPAHLAILRSHLDREQHARLAEVPDPQAYGWTGGRAHEIVLPLAATNPAPTGQATARPASGPTAGFATGRLQAICHPGHQPGTSTWLYTRLHVHPDRQSELLTRHLPSLLATWPGGPATGWWFLRHQAPDHHLRLRIPLHHPGEYGNAAHHVGRWADEIRDHGLLRRLTLDTYYPEPGRYGTGEALMAAETVFAADSAAALAQLDAAGLEHPAVVAVTAASMLDLAAAFTGSLNAGADWLTSHVLRHSEPPVSRPLHNEAMRLANPANHWAELRHLCGGTEITDAWERRRQAVVGYRALLAAHRPDPDAVLTALLHLHHARMAGLDPASERLCLRLGRAAALAHRMKG
ncbi:lantibiotic dehydratase [Nonomuraea sp. NPDC059007]|uniref:lantibiotic dehydratase n=1 Tax=Nonomuraea sp. NPDC059007 TaxID=3346692 RepID=UPI0036B142C1